MTSANSLSPDVGTSSRTAGGRLEEWRSAWPIRLFTNRMKHRGDLARQFQDAPIITVTDVQRTIRSDMHAVWTIERRF